MKNKGMSTGDWFIMVILLLFCMMITRANFKTIDEKIEIIDDKIEKINELVDGKE